MNKLSTFADVVYNDPGIYYDTIILQEPILRQEVSELWELEKRSEHLIMVDMESVLCVVLGTLDDIVDKHHNDIVVLVRTYLLETLDFKYPRIEETDVEDQITLLCNSIASFTIVVLKSLEELGFINHGNPGQHFPFALKRILPNNDLIFERQSTST